jgi:hypothetical protein
MLKMSSKVILLTAALASIGAGYFFFFMAGPDAGGRISQVDKRHEKPREMAGSHTGKNVLNAPPDHQSVPASTGDSRDVTSVFTETTSKDAVMETIHDFAVTYDAKELPRIQPFLLHPDREVRKAAIEGMVLLGDAAAAPMLRSASRLAPSPEEAVAMNEAAEYVELPSGTLIGAKSMSTGSDNRPASNAAPGRRERPRPRPQPPVIIDSNRPK